MEAMSPAPAAARASGPTTLSAMAIRSASARCAASKSSAASASCARTYSATCVPKSACPAAVDARASGGRAGPEQHDAEHAGENGKVLHMRHWTDPLRVR